MKTRNNCFKFSLPFLLLFSFSLFLSVTLQSTGYIPLLSLLKFVQRRIEQLPRVLTLPLFLVCSVRVCFDV